MHRPFPMTDPGSTPGIRRARHAPSLMRAALAVTLTATLAAIDTAPARAETFTPEHVAKMQYATGAAMSPDGKWIAYTVSVPRIPFDEDSGSAYSELHVTDLEGNTRPFITGKTGIRGVQWTPDGKGISFLAKRGDDEHRCLHVIPVDGGESRAVLEHETDISSYTWSPDGKQVAFLATDKEDKDIKKLKDKGLNAEIYEEDYREVRAWIGSINDDSDKPVALELPGSPSELHWSPAGDRLVVALAPTPLIDDSYMFRRLHVIDLDGKIVTRINNVGKLGDVHFSPDGRHLAMITAEDLHDPSAGRLVVTDTTSGDMTELLPNYEGHVSAIGWQDNETVMFLGDEHCHTVFGEIKIDGTGRKTHIEPGKHVISGLSLSRDGGHAAMRIQSPMHPSEVFAMSHGDAEPRRLTNSNPWLDDMEFARQEVVTFKARDDMDIDGILIHPLNEEAGKRYPLILTVHGGPEAHESDGWLTVYSRLGQVAAARGFAVFYPNYRGSTGRGVAFSKLGQADYGGKEFDDLIDAVDHLIEIGLVDRDRVGVTGGSYGGFATAWCSTYHSERFAAGCMFVGISDHISKGGTTDIPEEMFLVHSRTRLWDGWQFFLERSPIYHVQKSQTPLLILHGKNDTRVHPSQSMELYRHLKTLGKAPVRLVFYPGEGHGNRRSGARYDYNLRTLRWFEHYLKGPGGEAPDYQLDYPLNEKNKDKEGKKDDEAEEDNGEE